MSVEDDRQLICIASFDRACGDDFEEGLDVIVVPVGPEAWARVLAAAEFQENDDERCDGYVVKVSAVQPTTGFTMGEHYWENLCQDQVERIYDHLGECRRDAIA